jgi:PEGA domain-containing protein/helix-turn-helix protein
MLSDAAMASQRAATAARTADQRAPTSPAGIRQFADAADFGAYLREHREARLLTVQKIAEITRIPAQHFHDLERGDIRRWPGGMYRRAMVRAYARAVELDAEATVHSFLGVYSDNSPAAAPADDEPTRARQGHVPRVAAAVWIIGAAAALLTGWYATSFLAGPVPRDTVPAPYTPPAAASVSVETPGPPALDPAGTTTESAPAATSGTASESLGDGAVVAEGELSVQSDPDGAQVTVNGIGWGRTPVTVKYLPTGEKRVRLTKDGYVSVERRIQISAEQPVGTLRVTLEPADTMPVGPERRSP